ncbi:MAG TPA: aspartate carbamoyltransferase, partial [Bryobacterales bacterium]|nr:aspartate carbamoyltransferase [Bryobacterales bacterium]
TSIPGFPDPDITHPNIRFQQMKTLEREVTRLDSMPVRYEMDDEKERYVPALDPKLAGRREWNLGRLLTSHEMAHVAFTLSAQAVMAAFLLLVPGSWLGIAPLAAFSGGDAFVPTLWIMVALLTFGLFKLNMHLGRPHRFYRGFYNLRMSPVSREIAGVSAFSAGLAGYAFLAMFDGGFVTVLRVAAALVALAGLAFGGWYMYRLYRIKARPFWDHWHTAASFAGSGLALGALLIALCAAAFGGLAPELGHLLAGMTAAGIALEAAGLAALARDIAKARNEGAASWHILNTLYGRTFLLRLVLMAAAFILAVVMAMGLAGGALSFPLLAVLVLPAAVIGRALFFACVIPTTMPGAYFWRNPGFVEHAREIGLARMPQVGIAYEGHHRFRLDELMATIRETTWQEKWEQFRRIFTG